MTLKRTTLCPTLLRAWLLPIYRLYNHGLLFARPLAGEGAKLKGITP